MADNLKFDGRVIAITGAGGGLGKAHALDLASRGARIVVNDLGGATDGSGSGGSAMADQVVAEIKEAGGEAVANYDSVATQKGGEAITQTAMDTWGQIDGIIANAGILRDRSFAKLSVEELDIILDVHLRGTIFTVQPAFRYMKDAGNSGRIVVTTSPSGLFGNFGQTNYSAAKMGIVGLMRVIWMEGAKYDITVNALGPAAATRLTGGENFEADNSPTRVTPLVTALMHPSNKVTGETFVVGGGWYARAYMGLSEGWDSGDKAATAEDIIDHWDDIRNPKEVIIPRDAHAAMAVREKANK